MRIGIGQDKHLLVRGRNLKLGGVSIPYSKGLKGHSDADVVLHALIDAILGALGEGDIGEWFPDTIKKKKGISSREYLKRVKRHLDKKKFLIMNVDTIIHAEKPRLGPYKSSIRRSIAALTNIACDKVNVKAKTGEGLGDVGRGKALEATCIVLLKKKR